MKELLKLSVAILFFFCLSSCGVSAALMLNPHITQVQLQAPNFKVVEKVSGSAEVDYVFLIGGLNRTQLYENAYSEMVKNAHLESGSKALANIITEEHVGGLPPFYFKRTITVSAHVVEFIR